MHQQRQEHEREQVLRDNNFLQDPVVATHETVRVQKFMADGVAKWMEIADASQPRFAATARCRRSEASTQAYVSSPFSFVSMYVTRLALDITINYARSLPYPSSQG